MGAKQMISPEEANGFLVVVYETMERMTTKDRGWFIKALKMAKKQMDVNYPNGKLDPEKAAVSPIILPADGITVPAEGLLVPGGLNVPIKEKP
jgi:hypothetical protein